MKKLYFAAAAIATLSMVSCSKENEAKTAQMESDFVINASAPDTKTSVDDGWNVAWQDGDKLDVYINSSTLNRTFVFGGDGNVFNGTFTPDENVDYIWSVVYPQNKYADKEVDSDGYTTAYYNIPSLTNTQSKANDNSHLGGQPLCGYTETTGGESPSVAMQHLTTVICVRVNASDALDIKSIKLSNSASKDMSGTFYINCSDGSIKSSSTTDKQYTSPYTTLSVEDGAVTAGTIAEFYVPSAPFALYANDVITITITNTDGKEAVITKTMTSDISFAPGKIKTTTVGVSASDFGAVNVEKLTVAEFLAKEVSETDWYQLTGIVTNIANADYGNFDLKDETGTVHIYGLTQTKVAKNDNSFSKLGIKVGDEVTIITLRGEYNGTPQGGGKTNPAYYVSHKSAKAFTATLDKASVTSDAGTATIKITADADVKWTITNDNESVFTLSETSGTGSKDITVTYTANESTTDSRVANFVVSTSDFVATSSYSLKLTQLAVGVVPVETKTVTAETTYLKSNQSSGTLDDVISYSNDSASPSGSELRIYKGKTLTISAKTGYSIKKVELTCTANAGNKYGFYTTSKVSVDDGATASSTASDKVGTITITGNTKKVAYVASENQMRVTKMSVTYVED